MDKEQIQYLIQQGMQYTEKEKKKETLFKSEDILELNRVLNGGFSKGLCVIGGEPAVGKTTFALQLAREAAQQGKKVLFFSCEMTKAMIYNIIGESVPNMSVIDLSTVNITIEEFEDFIIEFDADVVVIDYLQLLNSAKETGNDKTNIDIITREVNRFTRANNILCFCISSINRTSYNSKPQLGCFKESGSIEYSADLAFVLVQYKETTTLHIIKNRYTGVKTKIKMKLNKERRFTDNETL